MKNIIYLSHGGQKYHDQTRFSVLTLLNKLLINQRYDLRIVIYTDQPEQAPIHDLIKVVHIDGHNLKNYRGPLDYVHRIKLEILLRAEAEFGLPFIYVDCDTRWLKIPDEPFAKLMGNPEQPAKDKHANFYMHVMEGDISNTFFAQYFHLLGKQRERLTQWGLRHNPPWTMWNSGTIGLPSCASGALAKILTMTDALLPHVRQRNWVEQLAISLVATNQFEVKAFDSYLTHYWNFSYELPVLLRQFFSSIPSNASVEALAEQCDRFPLDEEKLREIQSNPTSKFSRWQAKVKNSFYKRKIDLRAWRMRNGFFKSDFRTSRHVLSR